MELVHQNLLSKRPNMVSPIPEDLNLSGNIISSEMGRMDEDIRWSDAIDPDGSIIPSPATLTGPLAERRRQESPGLSLLDLPCLLNSLNLLHLSLTAVSLHLLHTWTIVHKSHSSFHWYDIYSESDSFICRGWQMRENLFEKLQRNVWQVHTWREMWYWLRYCVISLICLIEIGILLHRILSLSTARYFTITLSYSRVSSSRKWFKKTVNRIELVYLILLLYFIRIIHFLLTISRLGKVWDINTKCPSQLVWWDATIKTSLSKTWNKSSLLHQARPCNSLLYRWSPTSPGRRLKPSNERRTPPGRATHSWSRARWPWRCSPPRAGRSSSRSLRGETAGPAGRRRWWSLTTGNYEIFQSPRLFL